MELSKCNAELSNYSHLIGKELIHNSGLHFILVLVINCQEKEHNDYEIEVVYKRNSIGANGIQPLGFILANYIV